MTSVNLVLVATGLVIAAINGLAGSFVAARIARFFGGTRTFRPARAAVATAVVVATAGAIAASVGADTNQKAATCRPRTDAAARTTTTC